MKFKKTLSVALIVSLISITSAGCQKEEFITGTVAAGTVLGGLGTFLGVFKDDISDAVSISKSSNKNHSDIEDKKVTTKEEAENLNQKKSEPIEKDVEEIKTVPEISETEPIKIENPKPVPDNNNIENVKPATVTENAINNNVTVESPAPAATNNDTEKILNQVFTVKDSTAADKVPYHHFKSNKFCGYSLDYSDSERGNGMTLIDEYLTDYGSYKVLFNDDSTLRVKAENFKGTMQEARDSLFKNPNEDKTYIKNFQVVPIDENTVIQTWINTDKKTETVKKIFAVEDKYDSRAIQYVTFTYNEGKVTDRTKLIAKHIMDSFKPGLNQ